MPWKLIVFTVIMAVILVFVGFNLGNTCTLSFVFVQFDSVPVIVILLSSYILGLVSALCFALGKHGKLKKKAKLKSIQTAQANSHRAAGDEAPADTQEAPDAKRKAKHP